MDLIAMGWLLGGLVLLFAGGSLLVRGAASMARALGLSPLVIGLTIVALGTSAPEMATTVSAVLRGQGDIAFGNVVGSNILNVLLILGASALITPLMVARKLVRFDVPILIGLSLAVPLLALDGRVGRVEGVLLLVALVGYIIYHIAAALREAGGAVTAEARGDSVSRPRHAASLLRSSLTVAVGLGLLVWGARWVVDGATRIAQALGVSELIIGLTIVAIGTSLPEVATSIVAAWRGEREIAVANVVGSCVFNLLAVLGLAAVVVPNGVPAALAAMRFDVPVMIAASVACLPVFFSGWRIARWEGAIFVFYYMAYTVYLALDASGHDQLPAYSRFMLAFVVPLTGLTLAIAGLRSVRRG